MTDSGFKGMKRTLACPDCGAPLAITTEPANGYNEWSVVCSKHPHVHGPSVYDWPSEPVVVLTPAHVAVWLRAQAGVDGAHGSRPAFAAAARAVETAFLATDAKGSPDA